MGRVTEFVDPDDGVGHEPGKDLTELLGGIGQCRPILLTDMGMTVLIAVAVLMTVLAGLMALDRPRCLGFAHGGAPYGDR